MSTGMVTVCFDIPEELYSAISSFIEAHPDWTQDRAVVAAFSLFLMQNSRSDRRINRMYLDTLFSFNWSAA